MARYSKKAQEKVNENMEEMKEGKVKIGRATKKLPIPKRQSQ